MFRLVSSQKWCKHFLMLCFLASALFQLAIPPVIGAPKFMRAAIELRKQRALQAVREISPDCALDVERWCNRILLGEG